MLANYDPDVAPDPAAWLALDEQLRIDLVEAHHRAERVRLPNAKVHAVFHVIVENQIAEELQSVVRAMPRLMGEGLSRHEALHAIGSILAGRLYDASRATGEVDAGAIQSRYDAEVEALTVESWRRDDGE